MRLFMTADAAGGVWTYALDLAQGLADRGIATTLAVLGPEPDTARAARARSIRGLELIPTGLPLDWTERSSDGVVRAAERLADLAGRSGADVVQLNSAALGVADFPAPVVVVAHACPATWHAAVRGEPLPAPLGWRKAMAARGYEAARAIVAPSRAFALATAERYGLRRLPTVVRKGRPPVRASEGPAAFRREAFAVGRLWDEAKNMDVLDRAAAWIEAPVTAAGPLRGPHGAAVRFERLIAFGPVSASDVARRLSARPVFVSASLYEPFGLSALEAAQAGCAMVLSDIPTHRELWDGAADFTPPRDARALAQAVNRLLADPERRAEQGSAARARARRYSLQAMVSGMLGVYRSVRSGGPPRPAAETPLDAVVA